MKKTGMEEADHTSQVILMAEIGQLLPSEPPFSPNQIQTQRLKKGEPKWKRTPGQLVIGITTLDKGCKNRLLRRTRVEAAGPEG